MEKDEDSQGKKSKIVKLPSQKEKRKKTAHTQANKGIHKGASNIFVTDDRFHRAMDLIRNDMNTALSLGNNANNSYYLLLKFLVEKKIINIKEFESFIAEEIKNMPKNTEEESEEYE